MSEYEPGAMAARAERTSKFNEDIKKMKESLYKPALEKSSLVSDIAKKLGQHHAGIEDAQMKEELKKVIKELSSEVSGRVIYVMAWALERITQLEANERKD